MTENIFHKLYSKRELYGLIPQIAIILSEVEVLHSVIGEQISRSRANILTLDQ